MGELQCEGVAVWGSCGVGESRCGGVAVWGSCGVGESRCGGRVKVSRVRVTGWENCD